MRGSPRPPKQTFCFSGIVVLAALIVLSLAACSGDEPESKPQIHTVDCSKRFQTIDNFGASDCWTIEFISGWSDESRNKMADLLFSRTKGIGLSCWRVNLGGGLCPESVQVPMRNVETYEVAGGEYDWTRCPGQRWFMAAANARGVPQFLAFVNSPPRRMTRNGMTNCWGGVGTTNLKDGYEHQFAKYLVDILKHFRDNPNPRERIEFDYVSPVNEPQYEWNGPHSQEGNRASNDDIKRIVRALYSELGRQEVDAQIIAPEAANIYSLHCRDHLWNSMMRMYETEYGDYIYRLCMNPEMAEAMGKTICYHDYGSDWPPALIDQRHEINREMNWLAPGWKFWMTEYCYLEAGRDLGMGLALHVARLIHFDLSVGNCSAWQWWTALDNGDYKAGLVYTDWCRPGDEESVIDSKLLWALGNYSRFIRPGWQRVELAGVENHPDRLMGSAYVNPRNGRIALVYVNRGNSPVDIQLSFTGSDRFLTLTPYVTSEKEKDDLKRYPSRSARSVFTIPSRSVVTLVSGIGVFHTIRTIINLELYVLGVAALIGIGLLIYRWHRKVVARRDKGLIAPIG